MGISREDFYDEKKVAIVPMGFCYPGAGKSGDLPPRPEYAELWHERLLAELTEVKLTLVLGRYAQNDVLGKQRSVTKTVELWKGLRPKCLPLPHPVLEIIAGSRVIHGSWRKLFRI